MGVTEEVIQENKVLSTFLLCRIGSTYSSFSCVSDAALNGGCWSVSLCCSVGPADK